MSNNQVQVIASVVLTLVVWAVVYLMFALMGTFIAYEPMFNPSDWGEFGRSMYAVVAAMVFVCNVMDCVKGLVK